MAGIQAELEEAKDAHEMYEIACREEWRFACISLLKNTYPTDEGHDKVREYVSEAEHQDGKEYWDQFDDIEFVLTDFELYIMAD